MTLTDPTHSAFESTPILVVVVLYRTAPTESAAFRTLREFVGKLEGLCNAISCVVFDNSPFQHCLPPVNFRCSYVHDSNNPGLARPYQQALQLACEAGIPWLLLLDQDTALTEPYF